MKEINSCAVISSPYSWGGGIKTMIDEGIKTLNQLEYKTQLVYPNYAPGILGLILLQSRINQSLEIPTLPYPKFDINPLIHHVVFGLKAKHLAEKYKYEFAVVATAHGALPLALSNLPFSLWVATTYDDELTSKYQSASGDEPAKKLRNSKLWKYLESLERFVLSKSQHILALSEYTADKITQFDGVLEPKVRVLHPPIDTDLFKDASLSKDSAFDLVYVGRLDDPRKNVVLLLRSIQAIKRSKRNIRVLLIGDNPPNSIYPLIELMGLQENIKVLSTQSRRDIPQLLNSSKIFIATPTQEGLGISVLEAMSCGLPVVITSCGGPESIVKESGGGIITSDNPDHVAENALWLLSDIQRIRTIGMLGASYIRSHFTYDNYKRTLLEVMNDQN